MRRIALVAVVVMIAAALATPANAAPNRPAASFRSIEGPSEKLPPWLRKTHPLIRRQWWIHSRYLWCIEEIIEGTTQIALRKCRGRVKGGPPYKRDRD